MRKGTVNGKTSFLLFRDECGQKHDAIAIELQLQRARHGYVIVCAHGG